MHFHLGIETARLQNYSTGCFRSSRGSEGGGLRQPSIDGRFLHPTQQLGDPDFGAAAGVEQAVEDPLNHKFAAR